MNKTGSLCSHAFDHLSNTYAFCGEEGCYLWNDGGCKGIIQSLATTARKTE